MLLRLVTAIRTPMRTEYLYAFDHTSSVIPFTSPYVDSVSRIIPSGTSGGRLAILIRLVHMPANYIYTMSNSPCRVEIPIGLL